jgi:CHAT domain-containing protein
MSALFDGKQYLIENYTTYNVLSADLTDMGDKLPAGTGNTPVLAMGLSDAVSGFNPLPNVPAELDAIVRNKTNDSQGIYPGMEFLNRAFDFRTLRDNLTGHKILHLATHGVFVPGSSDKSYLLLGTGEQLTIPKINALTGLSNIHLVVLSACETALAGPRQDGVEIASVAYYFMNQGAKAVMASLWSVNDASTSLTDAAILQKLGKWHSPKADDQNRSLASSPTEPIARQSHRSGCTTTVNYCG